MVDHTHKPAEPLAPLSRPSPDALSPDALPEAQGIVPLQVLQEKCIHIIDGRRNDTIPLSEMLAKSGFRKVRCSDWRDTPARDLIKQLARNHRDIDLILVDMSGDRHNGMQLCEAIRCSRHLRHIPVILIATKGRWQEETVYTAFRAGATDIVFTPVQRLELVPRVISALLLKNERDLRRQHERELESELAERKVIEARLQYLVSHDELTGLCNRRRLEQTLEKTVHESRYSGKTSTLLYIDLDQFKVINDNEGHAVGDRFLMSIANRLRQALTPADLLARISSDEYAILMQDTSVDRALKTAEHLRATIDDYRFTANHRKYHIGASIGVAVIDPQEEITASEILARAAQACFEAKSHGRNMVHLFSHDDTESHLIRRAVDWVPRIRDALMHNRFRLLYQPVIRVDSGALHGYEALIRMEDDVGKLITPDCFIPIAERMGLIREIDLWVIGRAIEVLQDLPPHLAHITVNINLSMHAFQDPALLEMVRHKLADAGVAARRITFEITETAATANYAKTREMIQRLRNLGCRFALDDFGSGFSSFNYIKQFPVDYLKIDGSFIRNLVFDAVDQQLVRSMVEVAHILGKQIVAEYVENGETMALLHEYGVDLAQGHYIGKAAPEMNGSNYTTHRNLIPSAGQWVR